jgi:hypothetical protein
VEDTREVAAHSPSRARDSWAGADL